MKIDDERYRTTLEYTEPKDAAYDLGRGLK